MTGSLWYSLAQKNSTVSSGVAFYQKVSSTFCSAKRRPGSVISQSTRILRAGSLFKKLRFLYALSGQSSGEGSRGSVIV